ncbi:MAG: hypothetical protein HY775_12205 [Acidobacteria bacterium]|nr:hypothetical protein [Acidobacteriota bacterium]
MIRAWRRELPLALAVALVALALVSPLPAGAGSCGGNWTSGEECEIRIGDPLFVGEAVASATSSGPFILAVECCRPIDPVTGKPLLPSDAPRYGAFCNSGGGTCEVTLVVPPGSTRAHDGVVTCSVTGTTGGTWSCRIAPLVA